MAASPSRSSVDQFWHDKSKSSYEPDTSIAFLGSDKTRSSGQLIPGDILLQMILRWHKLTSKYPQHLGGDLHKSDTPWSSTVNTKWLSEIINKGTPILIFHPRIAPETKSGESSPSYTEFLQIIDSKKYDCYSVTRENIILDSAERYLQLIESSSPPKDFFPPILFYPTKEKIEDKAFIDKVTSLVPFYEEIIDSKDKVLKQLEHR